MPNEVSLDDVKTAYVASWKLGLKAMALYRDGSKLSQPLSAKSDKKKTDQAKAETTETKTVVVEDTKVTATAVEAVKVSVKEETHKTYSLSSENETVINQMVTDAQALVKYNHDGSIGGNRIYLHGEQRKMPYKRTGITVKTKIAGQTVFLRTGEYPDGRLGEIFIDMYKEGAAFRSTLNLFAISVSTGLQYGVPLEEYVDKFTFTRFEPSGITDHPNIKFCTSIIDFVFRVLGMEYLGRTDFVQVKPTGIQKNKAQQVEQMAAKAAGQHVMSLSDKSEVTTQTTTTVQASLPTIPKVETQDTTDTTGVGKQLSGMMGDAPPCGTCGHITIRNGACYKCLNCGSTTGCS